MDPILEEAFALWEELNPDVRELYNSLLTKERVKKGKVIPFGYTVKDDLTYTPIPEHLELVVKQFYLCQFKNAQSLRESAEVLGPFFKDEGRKVPNPSGMHKVFTRIEKDLGLQDDGKLKDSSFISQRKLMADEIRKKTGRTPHSKDLRKEYAKLKYLEKKRELEALRVKEKRAASALAKTARRAGVGVEQLQEDVQKYASKPKETEEEFTSGNRAVDAYLQAIGQNAPQEELMRLYLLAVESGEEGRPVAFLPTPKQYDFLSANEDFVLYGGAAGGGKSYAILFDAVRNAHLKGYRGVIIRRSMPELRELIDISREIYPAMFKGAKYNTQEKTWRFPSGAILEFGFLDAPSDKYQYQGKQYAWVGFDELGLQATPEGFDYLKSRLRTTLPIKPVIRCTANPGSLWVKERFIDPAPPNTTFRDKVGLTYRFIPSLVSDNPFIYQNGEGQYVKMLSSMSEVERRQLLEGDWTVSDDSAFPEFTIQTHVVPRDYFVPRHWNRFAGIDYGYSDNSAVVWCAVNPDNGQIVVYREFAESGLYGAEFARRILELEREELVPIDHVVDWQVWAKTGHTGPTIGQSMQRVGLRMRKADKNRIAGKEQIHMRLSPMEGGEPGLIITEDCPRLIRELQSLKRGDKDSTAEDIKQTRLNGNHNDLYDALRYALMSRPRRMTREDAYLASKQESRWGHINKMFS